ncbi:ABC transporter ATP-binding protein [Bacillus massiliigorillae]|uniref:ABC transporter ATP-binding protein n=1 Tax=Bacillus massiliigorillae TaxID=1243664 RepID=UPI0003A9A07F|nr:ABC transporter ATP-binding protein [Bacillus massiliigorillae]
MKVIGQFLKPYKLAAVIAIIFMLAELAVELFQPLLMAQIINEGVMKENLHIVIVWGSVMILFSILAFIAGIANTFYASHVSQSFSYDMRKTLFKRVQSLSYSQFTIFPKGSLMTRLTNDVQQLQVTVFMVLRIMLRAPLLIIGGLVMAFIVHPSLAMFLGVVVPLLFVFVVNLFNKGGKMFKTVQQRLDQVNNVMSENLAGMKLIRAFRRSDYEINRFEEVNKQLKERTASVLRFMEVTMPALLLLMNMTVICILWFGNKEIMVGTANVGEVVAIVNYSTRITSALSMFSFLIVIFSRSKASASRIEEVLETPADMSDTANDEQIKQINGEVTFENVGFYYQDETRWALKNVSFSVKPGQTLAILGATGSGKTTVMHLIPRLYDTCEGKVLIDGVNVKDYNQDFLRKQIGIVPQEALLFTGTIRENILWGKHDATDSEIQAACEHAQIAETIKELPEQLDTLIGQRGVNLSGGQRQRLTIARALIRKPSVLLLDDSTSALDSKTEQKLLKALASYNGTKIMVTQKISTALHADRIMLLLNGEKVAEGTHEELQRHSSLYRDIITSQLEGRRESNVMETTK